MPACVTFPGNDGSYVSIKDALASGYAGLRDPDRVVINTTLDVITVKIVVNTLVIHIDTLAFTSCTVARL
jgi:hypothetical protein